MKNRKAYNIFDLIMALRHKEETDLTRKDKKVIEQFYTEYYNNVAYRKRGVRLSSTDVTDELLELGLEEEADAYLQRLDNSYDEDYKIFEFALKKVQKNILTFEERKNINIFKALLKYKDKTITLTELYEFIYRDLMSASDLKNKFDMDSNGCKKFANPEDGFELLKDINGCFSESVVADIDMSNFNLRKCNIRDIKVNQGTYDNPRIFISGLRPAPLVNLVDTISNEDDTEISFLVISDIHLASPNSHNYDGNINDKFLEDELDRFSLAKSVLFSKLKKEGIKLSGLVFAGDFLDAGGGLGEKTANSIEYVLTRKSEYINKFIEFSKQSNGLAIPSKENGGPNVVLYIPGNHDLRVGRKNLEKIVELFREDAINLEGGSARVALGNDSVSVSHPSARDWGVDMSFTSRTAEVKASFHLREYFDICKSIYDSLDEKKTYSLEELLRMTDKKIKEENPVLYDYFKPYITPKEDNYDVDRLLNFIDNRIKIEDADLYHVLEPLLDKDNLDIDKVLRLMNKKLRKDKRSDLYKDFEPLLNHSYPTFFANTRLIAIDAKTGELTFNGSSKRDANLCKMIGAYNIFLSGNEGRKIAESMECNIPQYINKSRYAPILSILGHFHISNDSINKFWDAKESDPVISREGCARVVNKTDRYYLDTTVYTLNISKGKVSNIKIIPHSVILNRTDKNVKFFYNSNVVVLNQKEYPRLVKK